jgi:hypothetical protein
MSRREEKNELEQHVSRQRVTVMLGRHRNYVVTQRHGEIAQGRVAGSERAECEGPSVVTEA